MRTTSAAAGVSDLPLVTALLATLTGGLAASPRPDLGVLAAIVLGCIVLASGRRDAPLWLLFGLAGFVWFCGADVSPAPPLPQGHELHVGEIRASGWGKSGAWVSIATSKGPIRVLGIAGDPPAPGLRAAVFGSPKPPLRNPGRRALPGSAVHLSTPRALFVLDDDRGLRGWVHRARVALRTRLTTHFTGSTGGLAAALVIGDRSRVPDALTDRYRALGLSHLLAISGLHVGIISAALYAIVRALVPAATIWPWIVAMSVAAFAALAGGSASVVRATVMASTALGFLLLGRRVDPIHALAVAAWITILLTPRAMLGLGGSLSYAATAGILLYLRFFPRRRGRGGAVMSAIAISVAAGVATAPILADALGAVPLAGIVLSVPGGLAVTFALVPLVLALLAWPVPVVHKLLLDAAWPGLAALRLLAHPSLPAPTLVMPQAAWILLVAGVTATWLWRARRRPAAVSCLVGVAGWAIGSSIPVGRAPELVAFDVGNADALLLRLPDGDDVLIDTGREHHGRTLASALRALRSRPAHVVVTHPHDDHDGGLLGVREAMPIDRIIVGTTDVARVRRRSGYEHARLKGVARGDTLWSARDGALVCLHPMPADSMLDANERSVVLGFRWGRRRMLLTGDLEGEGLDRFRARESAAPPESLDAWLAPGLDILKLAHHGSPAASPADVLEQASPRIAVVSAGRPLDHDLGTVLDDLRTIVWSTWSGGATRIRLEPEAIEISRWRGRWKEATPGDALLYTSPTGQNGLDANSPPKVD